jgi:hypothetical protein
MRVAKQAGIAAIALMLTGCGQPSAAPVLDSAIAASPAAPASAHASPPRTVSPAPTGSPSPVTGPSPVTEPSPAAGQSAASPAASPSPRHCSSTGVTITNADNGETLCVRRGAVVLVLLSNATGSIRASAPLTARPEVLPRLLPGVKGAAYAASKPGVATISAILSPCGTGPGIHCMLMMLFRVTIDIAA